MISLHTHSYYTLLQGTISIDELVTFAKKEGSSYVALTDTNNMYGLIPLAKEANSQGIKPIFGALVDDPFERDEFCIILARNNNGYSQLCDFITARQLKEDFRLTMLFENDLDDVFILTSSMQLLEKIKYLPSAGQNLFVELFITEKHKRKTRQLYNFAKENNLPIVATHPAYFKPGDYPLHQVVSAVREVERLEDLPPGCFVDPEFSLKTTEEIKVMWEKLPEAVWNAERIAKECNVNLELGKFKFPTYPAENGEDSYTHLWKLCSNGLQEKYPVINEEIIKRLTYELEVIEELGYTDYFLVVNDIVKEAKRRNSISIGRGSAANSIVSYLLDFTQVDPIKHHLYFERFLNRARTSPPDIDIDFSWKERDDLVKYVYNKYGYDRVAMISTMVKFRARSAFRQVAKAYGFTDEQISKWSKYIPWTSASNLIDIAEKFPEAEPLKILFADEPWKSIQKFAARIDHFPHHPSIHPSGIVISPTRITDYVALEYAKNKGIGLIITQPDMYSIEDIGLVKIDLLSQRSLEVMKNTIDAIDVNIQRNSAG